MDSRTIPAGTTMYIGAPANPMPEQAVQAIAAAIETVPEVLEAHLPQLYFSGDDAGSRQVLMVQCRDQREVPQMMARLQAALDERVMFHVPGNFLDIIPVREFDASVKECNCLIFLRK